MVQLFFPLTIAVGLAAIYWLPAMTTQEFVSMEDMQSGRFYYANNFLFAGSRYDPYDFRKFERYTELGTVMMGGLAFFAWKASNRNMQGNNKGEPNYWLLVAIASIFMTLPLSKFIWDILPPLQKIQFPTRFNVDLEVAVLALIATAIPQVRSNMLSKKGTNKISLSKKLVWIIYYITAAFLMTAIQILPLQDKFVFPGSYNTPLILFLIAIILLGIYFIEKPFNRSFYKPLLIVLLLTSTLFLGSIFHSRYYIFFERRDNTEISKILQASISPVEHRPKWVPKDIFNESSLLQLEKQLNPVNLDSGSASWVVKQWQAKEIVLAVDAAVDTKLTLHQFYYPGWTAKSNSIHQNLSMSFSELGLLQVSVPKGQYEVEIKLEPSTEEKIGQTISISSIVLIVLLLLFNVLAWDRAS